MPFDPKKVKALPKPETPLAQGLRVFNQPLAEHVTGLPEALEQHEEFHRAPLDDITMDPNLGRSILRNISPAHLAQIAAMIASFGSGTPALVANTVLGAQGGYETYKDLRDKSVGKVKTGLDALGTLASGFGLRGGISNFLKAKSAAPATAVTDTDKVLQYVDELRHAPGAPANATLLPETKCLLLQHQKQASQETDSKQKAIADELARKPGGRVANVIYGEKGVPTDSRVVKGQPNGMPVTDYEKSAQEGVDYLNTQKNAINRTQKANDTAAAAEVKLQADLEADKVKEAAKTVKSLNEGFKANADATKGIAKAEQVAVKSEAKGKGLEDKFNEAMSKKETRMDSADAQAKKIADLKGTLSEELQPSVMRETVSAPGEYGGTQRATIIRTRPKPPVNEEGGAGGQGDDASGLGPSDGPNAPTDASSDNDTLAGKVFYDRDKAVTAARAMKADNIVGNRVKGYQPVFYSSKTPKTQAGAVMARTPSQAVNSAQAYNQLSKAEQDALTPILTEAMNGGFKGDIDSLGNQLAERLSMIKEGHASANQAGSGYQNLIKEIRKGGAIFDDGSEEIGNVKQILKANSVGLSGLFSKKVGRSLDQALTDITRSNPGKFNDVKSMDDVLRRVASEAKPNAQTPIDELTASLKKQGKWWEPKTPDVEIGDYTGGSAPERVEVPVPGSKSVKYGETQVGGDQLGDYFDRHPDYAGQSTPVLNPEGHGPSATPPKPKFPTAQELIASGKLDPKVLPPPPKPLTMDEGIGRIELPEELPKEEPPIAMAGSAEPPPEPPTPPTEPVPVPRVPKPQAPSGGAAMQVPEFAQALAKESRKPIAKVPFQSGKISGGDVSDSPLFKQPEPSLFGPTRSTKPDIKVVTDLKGVNHVIINGEDFTNRFGPGGPTDAEIRGLYARVNDPESFKRLAELKGEQYVGMAEPQASENALATFQKKSSDMLSKAAEKTEAQKALLKETKTPEEATNVIHGLKQPKTAEDIMEQTGVTTGQKPYELGNVVASPPKGLLIASDRNKTPGKLEWTRNEFEGTPAVKPEAPVTEAPKPQEFNPNATSEDLAKMSSEEQNTFFNRMKERLLSEKSGSTTGDSEKGFAEVAPMFRLAGGTSGAAYGAATGDTPEDRVGRALAFGSAGVLAPSLYGVGPKLKPALATLNRVHNTGLLSPFSVAKKGMADIQGLGMAAAEHPSMAGDIIKQFTTAEGRSNIGNAFKEGFYGPEQEQMSGLENYVQNLKNPMSWAGRTMGGLTKATKGVLGESGFTPEEQAYYTLTAQPKYALTKHLYGLVRGSSEPGEEKVHNLLLQHLMPFARIGVNRLERGWEYSPAGLAHGLLTGDKKLLTKGAVGSTMAGGAYALTPDDFVKEHPIEASIIAAGPAGLGMLGGMAMRNYHDDENAHLSDATEAVSRDIPGLRLVEDLTTRSFPVGFGRNYLSGYTNFARPLAMMTSPEGFEPDVSSKDLTLQEQLVNRALSNVPFVRNTLPPQ